MGEQNLSLPPELARLSSFISHIECLADSSSELCSVALCAAKHIFDWALETEESSKPHLKTLLATLTQTAPPQTRSRARNGSATTSPAHKRQTKINIRETPLPSLFIEGMNTDQIWQQLDLRAARLCENLQVLQGENEDEDDNLGDSDEDENGTEDEDEDETAEMEVDDDDDDDDDDESAWEGLSGEEEDGSSTSTGEGVIDLQEESSEDDDENINGALTDAIRSQQTSSSHSQGYTGLDDGFFDLAKFNAETDEVERKGLSKRGLDLGANEDSAEESEVDFFGSVDDLETEGEGEGHELFYNDFFKPPARTQNKSIRPSKVRFHERVSVKKIKAVGKGMPVSYMDDESDEEEED